MKYRFSLVYDFDATVAEAVAAYLDAEHYSYLHRKYAADYEILEADEHRMRIRGSWSLGWLRAGHSNVVEYVPPARFIQYATRPHPAWLPSIHHLIAVRTDLRYFTDEARQVTISQLDVELDLPFWLWPVRKLLRRQLERLKIEKDEEDIAMLRRRRMLFGDSTLKAYLARHQFMLFKDQFREHFGGGN